MNHFGPIPTLIVDLSPFCDLRCPMCPQGRGERGERRPMSAETVDAVIEGLAAHHPGAGAVLPFWNGEPLLSDNFLHFVGRLRDEKQSGRLHFGVISIHTNATRLGGERLELLLTPGLFGAVTLSLDAWDPTVYARIRRGGDGLAVREAVMEFLRRRRNGSPAVVLQWIAMAENEGDERDFVEGWGGFFQQQGLERPRLVFDECELPANGDAIFIRPLIPADETNASRQQAAQFHRLARARLTGVAPARSRERKPAVVSERSDPAPPPARGPCPGIFQHLGVDWRGEVSACCRDFNVVMRLGNVHQDRLADLWTGTRLRDWRLAHVEGRFADVPLCGGCAGQPFGRIEDTQVVEWLKSIGGESWIHPFLKRRGRIQ